MFDGDFDRDAERLTSELDGFADDPGGLRDAFLRRHVHALYAKLTDDGDNGLPRQGGGAHGAPRRRGASDGATLPHAAA